MRSQASLRQGVIGMWPLFTSAALVLSIVLISAFLSDDIQQTVTYTLVELIVVVGLYMFVGNSGVLSFGHMSFMAIGAYTAALLTIPINMRRIILPQFPHLLAGVELPTIPAIILGALLAALVALVVAVPLMRLSGIAASIATFAFLVVVQVVISNSDSVTHGTGTLLGMPMDTTMFGAAGWALLAIATAFIFQESALGLRLRASREDEVAAKAVGINVARARLVAFVISAFFVAIGGALYGHLFGSIIPDAFYLSMTFVTIAMLVIGGVNSLSGAVIGTVVFSALGEMLRRIEEGVNLGLIQVPSRPGLREVALAAIMLIILLFRPSGLTGGKEIYWPWKKTYMRAGSEVLVSVSADPDQETTSESSENQFVRLGPPATDADDQEMSPRRPAMKEEDQ